MNYRILLPLLLLLSGCAGKSRNDDVGEWMELDDNYPNQSSTKKYDLIGTDALFDGMVFWETSPYINQAPHSFHWYNDTLYLWVPKASELVKHTISIESCRGLQESLDILLNSFKESVIKMADDGLKRYSSSIIASPIYYRIKYYPPNMLGSLTFSNIERDNVQWIEKAKRVRDIGGACVKS